MQNKLNSLKKVFIFLLLATASHLALAQRTITGVVTDADNKETLMGVGVIITGTTKGSMTDVDGKYSIEVPADTKSLTFSFIGYQVLTLPLGASNVLDAALKRDKAFYHYYSPVIVRSLEMDFNQGNINDPIQLVQGKLAGLNISRPGNDPNGAFDIRLRGLSTITGNTKPLIIVNGIPDVPLSTLDPNDVSSVIVLKNGAEVAMYGVRGANGVILITTKIGKGVEPKVTYIGSITYEKLAKRVPVMSAADYLATGGMDLGSETDWISKVTQSAMSQNHHLSFGGGSTNRNYRASLNYRKA
jgi:TonB-dependent starch-binding outer membrane protein SusC